MVYGCCHKFHSQTISLRSEIGDSIQFQTHVNFYLLTQLEKQIVGTVTLILGYRKFRIRKLVDLKKTSL